MYRLRKKAIERGYQPESNKLLLLQYVEDAARSERPQRVNKELECELLANVQKDRNSREKPLKILSTELSKWLSMSSVRRILKKYGFRSVKKTVKPGLNATQKLARLTWCRDHEHWTLEDWKRVIFSGTPRGEYSRGISSANGGGSTPPRSTCWGSTLR